MEKMENPNNQEGSASPENQEELLYRIIGFNSETGEKYEGDTWMSMQEADEMADQMSDKGDGFVYTYESKEEADKDRDPLGE
jgi:hypothetical protein